MRIIPWSTLHTHTRNHPRFSTNPHLRLKMCVGHPKRHPCQHTSVNYNHCVAANFDPHTRVTTPCHNTTYAATIDSDAKCTNQLCYFEELGGSWICCQCHNGPNTAGWCTFHRPRVETNAYGEPVQVTTCDHCCCWNCTSYRELGGMLSKKALLKLSLAYT